MEQSQRQHDQPRGRYQHPRQHGQHKGQLGSPPLARGGRTRRGLGVCPFARRIFQYPGGQRAGRAEVFPQLRGVRKRVTGSLATLKEKILLFEDGLDDRAAELVKLLLQDKKVAEIARLRCVEVVTIKTQIKSLLSKFGCSRTKEIVKMIRQMNLEHLFQ